LPLSSWQNFYVIVGSSAGALTGLQFVVMTLVAQTRAAADTSAIRAFGTPTVLHFCTALFIAAAMTIPWPNTVSLAACLLISGGAGLGYSIAGIRHARKAEYNPDLEDWLWYAAFPVTAYAALLAASPLTLFYVTAGLFVLAGDSLVFLVIGIHNAWDTVTYIAVQHASRSEKPNR
jgi:hypothetical protein